MALLHMGSPLVTDPIQSLSGQTEELRSPWAAGGVVLGLVRPEVAARIAGVGAFLEELYPKEQAEKRALEARDPAERITAFRVLEVLDPDSAKRAAESLILDPDAKVRISARDFLQMKKAA